jgi:hypothetical protein
MIALYCIDLLLVNEFIHHAKGLNWSIQERDPYDIV